MSSTVDIAPHLDMLAFRNAMGRFASGVTVVTGIEGDDPIGFTCQSFYSVSLEPSLVSICVMKSSTTYPRIREAGAFLVNVLHRDQLELSNQFARRGTDKWAGVEWTRSVSGLPVLAGCLIWVECRIYAEHDAGDHVIVVGEVVSMGGLEDEELHEPLLFFKGRYRALGDA